MTRFRDVQQAMIMATVWIDDDKIKSDYNMKKTWITYAWWHSTIRRPTPMTTWHPRPTQCTWNATMWQVSVHVVFLLVFVSIVSSSSLIAHHIAWLKGPRVCTHLIHAWSERYSSTLSSPIHPTSSSPYSSSISRSPSCPSPSTRVSSTTVYSANTEMGVYGRILLAHSLKRIMHFFVGSWLCVPSFLVTNELHIQDTSTSTEW